MEFLHGPSSQTTNTDLAAALGTLGIPRDAEQPVKVLIGEIEQIAFFFGMVSACGHYETGAMIAAWDDPAFDRTHPQHAMSYMRAALRSRKKLLDYAKGHARIGIATRGAGKFEVVPVPHGHGRPMTPPPRVPAPDRSTTPRLQTDDLELAAALLACGIPLWSDVPIERRGENRVSFFFQPASPCGAFNTRELMLAWQDSRWHEGHPEHPFAYLWCVFENRRRLIREVKAKVPLVVFMRAGFPQFLSLNADAKLEKSFMEELKSL